MRTFSHRLGYGTQLGGGDLDLPAAAPDERLVVKELAVRHWLSAQDWALLSVQPEGAVVAEFRASAIDETFAAERFIVLEPGSHLRLTVVTGDFSIYVSGYRLSAA